MDFERYRDIYIYIYICTIYIYIVEVLSFILLLKIQVWCIPLPSAVYEKNFIYAYKNLCTPKHFVQNIVIFLLIRRIVVLFKLKKKLLAVCQEISFSKQFKGWNIAHIHNAMGLFRMEMNLSSNRIDTRLFNSFFNWNWKDKKGKFYLFALLILK